VAVRGEWLTVDGEPFLMKGVGYSPFRPGQLPWNTTVSLEVMASDFSKIREAGFNTIRTWAPLTPEQLALATQHGLMVLQGIWVDPRGDYTSEAFQAELLQQIRRQVEAARHSEAVLAIVVGNELLAEQVYERGVQEAEGLLRAAAEAVKAIDATRLVSYANWSQLIALDHSMWDFIGFNVYPYEPATVSHSFGFRSYVEHLKHSVAPGKPLIITELGVSVSPQVGRRPGYGGHSLKDQAREVVRLWDEAFQAGAQGACVFEWNDEWWKQADYTGDERVHDEHDPEEWFGLMAFVPVSTNSSEQAAGYVVEPRPAYQALKAYNHAILISPVTEAPYHGELPVSVYTTEAVRTVRVRLESTRWPRWQSATKVSPHWWKTSVRLPSSKKPRQVRFVMEARGHRGELLTTRERMVWLGGGDRQMIVTVETDRERYEVDRELEPMRFVVRVSRDDGQPVVDQPVEIAITELHAETELVESKRTDAHGTIQGIYLVREPGLLTVAAGTAPHPQRPNRRIGAERSVIVTKRRPTLPPLSHQPSMWERGVPTELQAALQHAAPAFELADPGTELVVDYARYGRFHDIGTPQYRYDIVDRKGLAAAVGEGIYPNEESLLRDPAYGKALAKGQLDQGSLWEYVVRDDHHLTFFKWAGTDEESGGVKQFFTAMALEQAGVFRHAIKAYDAILVHFPDAVGWTEFSTPWSVGQAAQARIEAILRLHPELGLRLEDARIAIEGGFDHLPDNDRVIVSPGRLVSVPSEQVNPPSIDLSQLAVTREIGRGRVRLRQYANRHWQLVVDGKPWIIRGISYQPSAVGESPDEGTLQDWMVADRNHNGKPDGPFDAFVDENRNNRQDPDEPTVGDFQLFKDLGINTLRLYHHASSKALLRQLYEQYGIMVLMGDLVGMYTVGSGATWEEGTNYLDRKQRRRMTDSVKRMVREFKDEPFVLMWVLGNENNYGGAHGIIGGKGNAGQYPMEYYRFLNELAAWIHREDPNHPVAIANGEWGFLDVIASQAPAIDVFGANVYRGWYGFGRSFFEAVRDWLDKPMLITEFGCPAYQAGRSLEAGELGQALYHFGNWVDLEDNMAGRGVGNALGGVVFAWVDEWWKAGQPPRFSPSVHDTTPNWAGPFPGGKNYEEWYGLMSGGDGSRSPYLRQRRKASWLYQGLWKSHEAQTYGTQ